MRWDELEGALTAEDWPVAIEIALDVWRTTRVPQLAEIVDAVSARLPPEGRPFRRDLDDFQADWIARVEGARAADRAPSPAVFASLGHAIRQPPWQWPPMAATRHATWLARVAALASLPDNPRVGAAIFEVVRRAPWTGYESTEIAATYDPALALLVRGGDERLLESLRKLLALPASRRPIIRTYLAGVLPQAIEALEARAAHRRTRWPLSDAESARAAALLQLCRSGAGGARPKAHGEDEATLLALVMSDIESDGPREVIADYWLEQGDPRGEFVSLQMKVARATAHEADHKAIRALLRAHEERWLGELRTVTKNRVWDRGFLTEIDLMQNAAAHESVWEAAARHPALGTVRLVNKSKANGTQYTRFLAAPGAGCLATLMLVTKDMLPNLLATHPEPWPSVETIVFDFLPDKKVLATLTAAASLFPALDKLAVGVTTAARVDDVLGLLAAFARERPLGCLAIRPKRDDPAPLVKWLSAVRGRLAHVPRLEVALGSSGRDFIAARRVEEGVEVDVACDALHEIDEILPAIQEVVSVTLRSPSGTPSCARAPAAMAMLRSMREGHSGAVLTADAAWTAALAAEPIRE